MARSDAEALPRSRSPLRWRIVIALLTVSLLPLCLLGVGAWFLFGWILENKAFELQQSVVERHAHAIDAYLTEHLHLLQLLADTHDQHQLTDLQALHTALNKLNEAGAGGFVDLGVIDAEGRHLAYAGPYDLAGRNYRQAEWFGEVMAAGHYISDVFLGYRQIPHCIIAVKVHGDQEPWLLRATINSEKFDALVQTGSLGQTGDAYLINRDGFYQTNPRGGGVLERAPLAELTLQTALAADRVQPDRGETSGPRVDSPPESAAAHAGVWNFRQQLEGKTRLVMATWVNSHRWLLVVQQDVDEVRAPVVRALTWDALLVLVSIVLIGTATILATRHLTNQIDRANQQREEMFGAFMRSAKLASIGELATGLAHEINNPLAIISAEHTNISDLVKLMDHRTSGRNEVLASVERSQRQVQRCGGITAKMLQFGRKQETKPAPTDIAPRLREIVTLMGQQARVANVALSLDIAEGLSPLTLDPVELEQVLINLIKNSLDALTNGGHIQVSASRQGDEVVIAVRDDGPGVAAQNLQRIFEPFFTTKPVGKGTGLGLSVCYGLVQSWGGRLEAESDTGRGMTMKIRLPLVY